MTGYSIISQIGRKGAWMENGDRNGIQEIGDPGKTPTQFSIGVDLGGLPPYAQDVAYLNRNLKLEHQGCSAVCTVLDKKDADRSRLRSEPQKAALEKSTHLLMIQLNSMALKKAGITVKLPLRYDTWYTAWSCMDDRSLAGSCAGKTFALEYLITGVKEAYETKNGNYLDFTINLQQ